MDPDRADASPMAPDEEAAHPSLLRRAGVSLLPLLVLAVALWAVRLPYFVLAPGPAQAVEPLIHVTGPATYPSAGHLLLTDVIFYQPNAYQVLAAWVNPDDHVVRQDELISPGQSQEQFIRQGYSQMDTSKIDAAVVALTHETGYPKDHGQGVLIENVFPGTPAANHLFPGDLITRVDGEPANVDRVGSSIKAAGFGGTVTFVVQAGGKTRTVRVSPTHLKGVSYPAIGVSLVANFPFRVAISSQGIGGPSAGLMWTLGLVDLLTPGDLTGGRTIAGTGEMGVDGRVRPIGGVEQKVAAAEAAHATVFFVPEANADDAASVAHDLTLVPVKTLSDALDWLRLNPAGSPAGG